jgi:GT2 family glycosyltransferase
MISIVVISKDEPAIDGTLTGIAAQAGELGEPTEIVVVDASQGRLDLIRRRHEPGVRWVRFEPPPGVTVTIAHQRNTGVREAKGEVIVFTDAGCQPEPGWLDRLLAPLREDEDVTAGIALAADGSTGPYGRALREAQAVRYLAECPTINLAFRREAFDKAGGFDEQFAYGSDVDFSWRLVKSGYRIRSVPDAVVRHDWGTRRRQLRRSYVYGQARARLYRKHRLRVRDVLRRDPIVVVYPLFLLGLPLTLVFPFYPALLLIPAWRNRGDGSARILLEHLIFGAGVLAELAGR